MAFIVEVNGKHATTHDITCKDVSKKVPNSSTHYWSREFVSRDEAEQFASNGCHEGTFICSCAIDRGGIMELLIASARNGDRTTQDILDEKGISWR